MWDALCLAGEANWTTLSNLRAKLVLKCSLVKRFFKSPYVRGVINY